MLLLGNSLLLEAVNYSQLKNSLSDEFEVHRLVFEQTEYLEQYYVLRTLFRHGSRPSYVVLCMSVDHLSRDETRGEFMSRYIDATDIASLGARKHDDPTTVSSQLFAHVSDWFANRAEIRKVLLGVAMPDVQNLTGVLAFQYAPPMSADEVSRKAKPRLQEVKELCERYGSRLVVVIPPTTRENHAEILISYGEALGVAVLMPEPVGAVGPELFRDGLHLTPAGAEIFTAKLQPQLTSLPRLSSSR